MTDGKLMTVQELRIKALELAREEYKGQTAPLLVTRTAKRYFDWLMGDEDAALGPRKGL